MPFGQRSGEVPHGVAARDGVMLGGIAPPVPSHGGTGTQSVLGVLFG
ncbi:hypothetical protein [Acanthopleuribacter pedis]|nr:hypothetical protein [Acanthopleuribacter pedis]